MRPLARTIPDPVAVLSAFIARRGLKSTRQRHVILETSLAADGHLTVDELLARAHGFSVTSHRMDLYGQCRGGQHAGKPRRRAAERRQPHA